MYCTVYCAVYFDVYFALYCAVYFAAYCAVYCAVYWPVYADFIAPALPWEREGRVTNSHKGSRKHQPSPFLSYLLRILKLSERKKNLFYKLGFSLLLRLPNFS